MGVPSLRNGATAMTRKRLVNIQAVTIEVHCPHCGDPLPAPDNGSHLWTLEMVRASAIGEGLASCNACDEPIIFDVPAKIGWLQ
jgi:hypothetical protein